MKRPTKRDHAFLIDEDAEAFAAEFITEATSGEYDAVHGEDDPIEGDVERLMDDETAADEP